MEAAHKVMSKCLSIWGKNAWRHAYGCCSLPFKCAAAVLALCRCWMSVILHKASIPIGNRIEATAHFRGYTFAKRCILLALFILTLRFQCFIKSFIISESNNTYYKLNEFPYTYDEMLPLTYVYVLYNEPFKLFALLVIGLRC